MKHAHQLIFVVKSFIVIDKNKQNLSFQSGKQTSFSLYFFVCLPDWAVQFFIDYIGWACLIAELRHELNFWWRDSGVSPWAEIPGAFTNM